VQGQPLVSVAKATLDLFSYFERHVKASPSKFQYTFNPRHMFRVIHGLAEADPNYLQSETELAKLWTHEAWRTFCDRVVDYSDKKALYNKFNEVARKHFNVGKNKLLKKVGHPFFCSFTQGLDGLYTEVTDFPATT